MMEIMTCEQYVLARLFDAEAEAERLAGEVERLEAQAAILEEGAKPTRLQEYIYSLGREAMLGKQAGFATSAVDADGEPVPFDVWCEDDVRTYGLPRWLSKAAIVEEFGPELMKAYEEAKGGSE